MTKKVWPVSFTSVKSWQAFKNQNLCQECVLAIPYVEREKLGKAEYHSTGDTKLKHSITCDKCETQIVNVLPNPYTIPELPNLGDVSFTWVMTKSVDNVFADAYHFHNSQEWEKANPDVTLGQSADDWEVRRSFNTWPDFYESHNKKVTLTWVTLGEVQKIINEYRNALETKKSDGVTTSASTAKMNLKKLEAQLDTCMKRALDSGVYKRTQAIKRAQEVSASFGQRNVYEIRCMQDSNRGILKVGAFNMTPQEESKYVHTYAEFSQDIDVYFTIEDGVPIVRFIQDDLSNNTRDSLTAYNVEVAVEEAKKQLQTRIDACYDYTDRSAKYAAEALVDAGIL